MTAVTSDTLRQTDISRPDERAAKESPHVNVSDLERIISGVAGGLLLLPLLKRANTTNVLLASLGAAMIYRAVSGHCPAYSALGLDMAHRGHASAEDYFDHGIQVEETFTIMRPAAELYSYWHDFSNLPNFMHNVEAVEVLSPTRSRWTAKAPMGTSVSWEAEIIHNQPNELIAWRSIEGADVDNAGTVQFTPRPDGEGTEVRVTIDYINPGGTIGHAVAKMFGKDPKTEIREDLRRFKRIMETGEVITTEGQPRGTCK